MTLKLLIDNNNDDDINDIIDMYMTNSSNIQYCIKTYLQMYDFEIVTSPQLSIEIKNKNKKIMKKLKKSDNYILTFHQKRNFLIFLYNFKKVLNNFLPLSNIEYYINCYNFCKNKEDHLPLSSINNITKSNKNDLLLNYEYNMLIKKINHF